MKQHKKFWKRHRKNAETQFQLKGQIRLLKAYITEQKAYITEQNKIIKGKDMLLDSFRVSLDALSLSKHKVVLERDELKTLSHYFQRLRVCCEFPSYEMPIEEFTKMAKSILIRGIAEQLYKHFPPVIENDEYQRLYRISWDSWSKGKFQRYPKGIALQLSCVIDNGTPGQPPKEFSLVSGDLTNGRN